VYLVLDERREALDKQLAAHLVSLFMEQGAGALATPVRGEGRGGGEGCGWAGEGAQGKGTVGRGWEPALATPVREGGL
jgi:hypothetical protein